MRHALLIALVALSFALAPPGGAETRVPESRAEITLSFAPVVETAAPAVVNIYASRVVAEAASPFARDPFFSQFFGNLGPSVPRVQNSLGSGVILSPDGIVVSNHHVVGDAREIRVVLSDRREYEGEILLSDPEADIAVIRLRGASDLPALPLGDSDAVAVGDLVLAIGNPFGVGQTVTSGIVSGLARSGAKVGSHAGYYIQTDAPINPGNSGGALVDMSGRLIGINTSILTRSGGSNGIGFAIPAALVRQYIAQAEAGRTRFLRPWAGIRVQEVDAHLAEALGQDRPQGVMIAEMHAESPFAQAGLAVGDVITALDGRPVNAEAELGFRLATLDTGQDTEVDYLRDGTAARATLTLAALPETDPTPVAIHGPSLLDGLSAADLGPRLLDEFDLPLDLDGAIVLGLDGYAIRSGLRRGDIIRAIDGQSVTTADDLAEVAGTGAPRRTIDLIRNGRRLTLRLRS